MELGQKQEQAKSVAHDLRVRFAFRSLQIPTSAITMASPFIYTISNRVETTWFSTLQPAYNFLGEFLFLELCDFRSLKNWMLVSLLISPYYYYLRIVSVVIVNSD
jgi:hypothetical protein